MGLTYRDRLSRRAFLKAGGAAALAGGAAAIFGCGSDQKKGASGGATPSPRRGGEIVTGHSSRILGIDPHIDWTGLHIDQLVYSYLYDWDPVNQQIILNNFASELEIPDPEGLEFIFSLRRGVTIQSQPNNPARGEELTSEDVKQSFIRRGTSITAPDKRLALNISGATWPVDAMTLAAALRTPDSYTFSFEMSEYYAPALRELANPSWAIVPAKVLERYGTFQKVGLGDQAFGSGPFILDGAESLERITLRRHPEYFLSPRPWLDRLTYDVVFGRSNLVEALASGRHDVSTAFLTKEEFQDFAEDGRFIATRTPTLYYPSLHFRMREQFADIRVREAIDLAIDRHEFLEKVWGGEGNYNGPIQWPQQKWALPQEELRQTYKFDRKRARALMEEAGYGDGFTTTMTFPRQGADGGPDLAEAAALIAGNLSEIGINVELRDTAFGTFIANNTFMLNMLLPGNYQMAFFMNLPYDEPDRPLRFYHSPGPQAEWINYRNLEVDRLIDAQAREVDAEKRQQIIYEVQRLMIKEHGPQITLPSGYRYSARRAYVHLPYELGEAPPPGVGPPGCDIWTEEA